MTKTEQALIKSATEDQSGMVAVSFGHITGRRNGSYGYRSQKAALNLVKAGRMVVVSTDSGAHHFATGSVDHYHTITLRRA